MTTRRAPAKPRAKRRPSAPKKKRSGLLEDCVQLLDGYGFHEYTTPTFKRAKVIPDRYVRRHYPHTTLYGTVGYKEGLIVAPDDGSGLFSPDNDGILRVVVEAKWQEGSGSTDEKLPLVWEAFLASPVRNWVVVLDGGFWDRTPRGKAAAAWLQAKTPGPEGRRLYVVDRRGFRDLIKRAWGREP